MLQFTSEADRGLMNQLAARAAEFAEAMARLAKDKALRRTMNQLEQGMRKAFAEQGKAYLAVLETNRDEWPVEESGQQAAISKIGRRNQAITWREALDSQGFEDALDGADDDVLEYFLGPLLKAAAQGLEQGARQVLAEIGEEIQFDLKHPKAVAYLQAHGADLVSRLNETTRVELKVVLNHGLDSGWSYKKTAEAVQNLFKDYQTGNSFWNMDAPRPQGHIDSRAHLIAVTEAGEAYEEGGYLAIGELVDAGIEYEKHWVTMGDERVSEGCQENEDEGWIGYEEVHASGDLHPLRFPGCRCDEEYRRVGSE